MIKRHHKLQTLCTQISHKMMKLSLIIINYSESYPTEDKMRAYFVVSCISTLILFSDSL